MLLNVRGSFYLGSAVILCLLACFIHISISLVFPSYSSLVIKSLNLIEFLIDEHASCYSSLRSL